MPVTCFCCDYFSVFRVSEKDVCCKISEKSCTCHVICFFAERCKDLSGIVPSHENKDTKKGGKRDKFLTKVLH